MNNKNLSLIFLTDPNDEYSHSFQPGFYLVQSFDNYENGTLIVSPDNSVTFYPDTSNADFMINAGFFTAITLISVIFLIRIVKLIKGGVSNV